MKVILEITLKQVEYLVRISKNDRKLLINIFEHVKKRKLPFQLPFNESEI